MRTRNRLSRASSSPRSCSHANTRTPFLSFRLPEVLFACEHASTFLELPATRGFVRMRTRNHLSAGQNLVICTPNLINEVSAPVQTPLPRCPTETKTGIICKKTAFRCPLQTEKGYFWPFWCPATPASVSGHAKKVSNCRASVAVFDCATGVSGIFEPALSIII